MEDFMALHKNMVYPIEPKLNTDFWKSTSVNELIIRIVARANLNTMDGK